MLTKEEISCIKDELENCKKPLFLFDDDADVVCSFLLLYRMKREGKGIMVKSRPFVDEKFAERTIEYDPDKIFILDLAEVKQEFIDMVKRPVIWIDHHQLMQLEKVKYFNPRKHKKDASYPTSAMAYDVSQQDVWIAMTGCIGDWHIPHFKEEFCRTYPDLLDGSITDPGKALFESKIGLLAKIINFIIKGPHSDTMKCVKVLSRIESPYEILNQETPQGKFIYKKFQAINNEYERLIQRVNATKDTFLLFLYGDEKISFTGEISNELLYRYPNKIIIVGREKSGEIRMSLRSQHVPILPALEKSLKGLDGYGGGHELACGACVKKEQFEEFIQALRKNMG